MGGSTHHYGFLNHSSGSSQQRKVGGQRTTSDGTLFRRQCCLFASLLQFLSGYLRLCYLSLTLFHNAYGNNVKSVVNRESSALLSSIPFRFLLYWDPLCAFEECSDAWRNTGKKKRCECLRREEQETTYWSQSRPLNIL